MAVTPSIFPAGPRAVEGEPLVVALNHGIAISRGQVAGRTDLCVQGFVTTASTNEEDVWAQTGTLIPRTTAIAMDIVSGSANDDGNPTTSTGLQTLLVEGLDASWAEQSVIYTMNGITPVVTGETWTRINKVQGVTWGTYHGANEGIITIRNTGGGDIQAALGVGTSVTQKSHYSVPAGKTAYMTRFDLNVDANKSAIFRLWCVNNINDVSQPFTGGKILLHRVDGVKGPEAETLETPIKINAMSEVWWTVESAASGTDIHVDYDLEIIDN
jgi:hypothetical protein